MFGTLSVIPTEEGGIIDDTMVTKCVSKEHGEQMGKFGGDVKMEVMWDERGLYALQGPKAVDVMQRLVPSVDFKKMSFGESQWMDIFGAECLISRCGYTGEDGFELFVPGDAAVKAWVEL